MGAGHGGEGQGRKKSSKAPSVPPPPQRCRLHHTANSRSSSMSSSLALSTGARRGSSVFCAVDACRAAAVAAAQAASAAAAGGRPAGGQGGQARGAMPDRPHVPRGRRSRAAGALGPSARLLSRSRSPAPSTPARTMLFPALPLQRTHAQRPGGCLLPLCVRSRPLRSKMRPRGSPGCSTDRAVVRSARGSGKRAHRHHDDCQLCKAQSFLDSLSRALTVVHSAPPPSRQSF